MRSALIAVVLSLCVAACSAQGVGRFGLGSRVRNVTLANTAGSDVAPILASLLSQAIANTAGSTGQGSGTTGTTGTTGTAFISGVAENFQNLLGSQAQFYNNLQSTLGSNRTFAIRTICELGLLYQTLPEQLTSSTNPYATLLSGSTGTTITNTLSQLLTDSAFARAFNEECEKVDSSTGTLSSVATGLLGNSAIAQQVEALLASSNTGSTGTTTTTRPARVTQVPAYLQGTALGRLLEAAGTPTSTPTITGNGSTGGAAGTTGLGATLLSSYLETLGGTIQGAGAPTSSPGSRIGSGSITNALLSAMGAATNEAPKVQSSGKRRSW